MPIRRAAMSSSTSRATVSNCHGPRYAVRPDVFEKTDVVLHVASGTRYGPGNNMPTAAATPTGHGVGYAPTSCTWSICAARIVPSESNAMRRSPCSWRA